MKMFRNLALLPAELIQKGYEEIKKVQRKEKILT